MELCPPHPITTFIGQMSISQKTALPQPTRAIHLGQYVSMLCSSCGGNSQVESSLPHKSSPYSFEWPETSLSFRPWSQFKLKNESHYKNAHNPQCAFHLAVGVYTFFIK